MSFEVLPNWHPIFVHFTIALFAVSTLMFVVGYLGRPSPWSSFLTRAAHLNLLVGAVLTLATVPAGFYAYYTVAHDGTSHRAMVDHRNWAVVAALIWWGLAAWSCITVRGGKARTAFIAALLFGAGVLGVAGMKGGEAGFRYGLGVMSLPQVEGLGDHSSHSHDVAAPGESEMEALPQHKEHGGHEAMDDGMPVSGPDLDDSHQH